MNLYEDKENFQTLITKTSEYMKIPEFFIEKDYWVTFLLRNLSLSPYVNQVVFKGGTSLSKAFGCIERFSEDIDLALAEPSLGDAKRKTLMKDIEKAVSKGLLYIKDYPQEEKRGRNRKTFYEYPRLDNNAAISPVKEIIQLEINTFTHPFPFEKHSIGTFIYKFLKDNQFNDSIEHYSLNPFSVNVLSLERTLFEKMLSLIRLSYEGSSSLRSKIRHFYDIASIMKMYNFSADSPDIFKSALEDDKTNATFAGKWLEVPLYKAPLFEKFKDIWADLSSTYKNELLKLIWSEKIISENEISKSFERIADFIQRNSK